MQQEIHNNDAYIFVSYAHKNADMVIPIVHALRQHGYKVWYDEGIEAGTEWPEYLAERIQSCSVFISFLSPAAISSYNCRNEINYAISLKKEMLTVYLEETNMTAGMQLQLGSLQAMFKFRHTSEQSFLHALLNAEILKKLPREQQSQEFKQQPAEPVSTPIAHAAQAMPIVEAVKTKNTIKWTWLSILVAVLSVTFGVLETYFVTKYIDSGWLIFFLGIIPASLCYLIFNRIYAKKSKTLSPEETGVLYTTLCVMVCLAFFLATVLSACVMLCANKMIFKILIAFAINVVAYFVALVSLP